MDKAVKQLEGRISPCLEQRDNSVQHQRRNANMSTVPEAAGGIGVVVVASPMSNPNKSTSGALNMKKMQALD